MKKIILSTILLSGLIIGSVSCKKSCDYDYEYQQILKEHECWKYESDWAQEACREQKEQN